MSRSRRPVLRAISAQEFVHSFIGFFKGLSELKRFSIEFLEYYSWAISDLDRTWEEGLKNSGKDAGKAQKG